jgi:hypothetical protein
MASRLMASGIGPELVANCIPGLGVDRAGCSAMLM